MTAAEILKAFIDLPFQDRWGSVEIEAEAALEELVGERDRYRNALQVIASTTYPARLLGYDKRGTAMYGGSDDASRFARDVLEGAG